MAATSPPPNPHRPAPAVHLPGAGVEIACELLGHGPTVLLLHGASGGRAGLAAVAEALAGDLRTALVDRRGWGESGAPDPYEATTVEEHAEDAAAVIESLEAAPAVVAGEGFGALVALDLCLRHPDLVHAAVLAEPPLGWLSPRGPELAAGLREAVEEAARDGAGAAVDAYLEWAAGPGAAARLGPERHDAARAAARSVFAELAAGHAYSVRASELRSLEPPVAVVWAAGGPDLWAEAGRALSDLIPGARAAPLEGAAPVATADPGGVAAVIRGVAA